MKAAGCASRTSRVEVRVRAANSRLTGVKKDVRIVSGNKGTNVTLNLQSGSRF